MYFSHSPYRAPVLLASVPQQHTHFINKSIYNALEETPIETQAVKIFQTKQMLRQRLIEHSMNDGTVLALYQGTHLCTWVCLPHKMAPGFGNGPWKWLLSCAYSTLYRLEFFMWQLGCWEIHLRGCALIKDSSSGHFCTASCGHWPPFHPWACSYSTALLLGLPVTPNNTLGVITWLEWLLTCMASWDPSPPDGESVKMITDHVRVRPPPSPKWRLCPWAFEGRILGVDSVKTSCQKWPTSCVILSGTAAILFMWKKFKLYSKTKKPSIIFYNKSLRAN